MVLSGEAIDLRYRKTSYLVDPPITSYSGHGFLPVNEPLQHASNELRITYCSYRYYAHENITEASACLLLSFSVPKTANCIEGVHRGGISAESPGTAQKMSR